MNTSATKPPEPESAARQMMAYDANKKTAGIAYVLWFFVGLLGGHRFYLGHTISGIIMLLLFVVTLFTAGIGLIVLGPWLLIDAFLIPGMVSEYNNALITKMA